MTADDVAAVRAVGLSAGERFRSIADVRVARCADDPPLDWDDVLGIAVSGRGWVATEAEVVVGFVVVGKVDGCAFVEELAVSVEHGGRGHGSALLDAVATWASSQFLPAVTLTTFRDVPFNRPFYERRGFRVLADEDMSDGLRETLALEDARGLPAELRVAMRLDLASPVRVREASAEDLPAITRLFNALIPTTTIAWRDHEATAAEMADWFASQEDAGEPVLVAELDGDIAGYTTWSWFRGGPRFPGYRHTRELTIHVDERHHGRGVGRALIEALVDRARLDGVHVLVAGIDADNESSIAFHRRFGFTEVARMPEVGRKFDRWLDLVLMQRVIDERVLDDIAR